MPFDLDDRFIRTETPRQRRDRRLVAVWLFCICGMLLVMIGLGGATRLTGSGLSIMEWAPIQGALPPLSEAEWQRLFKLYQSIPQYHLVNHGFGLDGFKHIFWLEYVHRLWGRLIAVVFAIPLAVLAWRGAIGRGLWLRLVGLLVLGGLQGAVGWFMVASGFDGDSVSVSAYRLVAHLVLAVTLYAAILWTGLSVLRPPSPERGPAAYGGFRAMAAVSCCMVGVTIVAGGFVAGLHAGLVYNSFPWMGHGLVPPDYAAMAPFLRNLTENVAAVQFDHRLLATATGLLVLVTAALGLRPRQPAGVRVAAAVMGAAVLTQYGLGVTTLLWAVPVPVATAHQVMAALLLTTALVARHMAGRPVGRQQLIPPGDSVVDRPYRTTAEGTVMTESISALATTDRLFFEREDAALTREQAERVVADALSGCDDGELFLEYRENEHLSLEDGRIRHAGFESGSGFGLRAILGEETGYAHAGEVSEPALRRAAATVSAVRMGQSGAMAEPPRASNARLYSDVNPLDDMEFAARTAILAEIDAYARAKDPRVKQVMASMYGEWQAVQVMRTDGRRVADIRPLVRLNISVVVEHEGRRETGGHGTGGRFGYARLLTEATWRAGVDEALRQALVNLDSRPAPAGEMEVVLGNGWPGILLHEAIGHGLEGDFNRKKTSAFSGLLGQRIAAPGVTVVDDGTLPDRRGSLTVDDEGTPSGRMVMIEDGVLTGFIQDRLNARLMGVPATGNGRRQSYAHAPMPRMTNTVMMAGPHAPEEMIRSVKRGLYAVNFGGGSVDITSGKFVFSASEAYLIEDGRVTAPVKGATLIGNGPDALTKVTMVGNDLALDPGVGTCGKNGQGVPVGVGQPTVKLSRLTVGGTA